MTSFELICLFFIEWTEKIVVCFRIFDIDWQINLKFHRKSEHFFNLDIVIVQIKGQLIKVKRMFWKTLNPSSCLTHNLNDLKPRNVRFYIKQIQMNNSLSPLKSGINNGRNIKGFLIFRNSYCKQGPLKAKQRIKDRETNSKQITKHDWHIRRRSFATDELIAFPKTIVLWRRPTS